MPPNITITKIQNIKMLFEDANGENVEVLIDTDSINPSISIERKYGEESRIHIDTDFVSVTILNPENEDEIDTQSDELDDFLNQFIDNQDN